MSSAKAQGAREAIAREVLGICAGVLLLDPGELEEGRLLFEELGAESIDVLDILTQLEERFGVALDPPPPFLDRAFFDGGAGHFEGGALSEAGWAALGARGDLDGARLRGDGAQAYLGSIAILVDLAHGGAVRRDAPLNRV